MNDHAPGRESAAELEVIWKLAVRLNQPMLARLRIAAAHDGSSDGKWIEAKVYTPEAVDLVALIDAALGLASATHDPAGHAQRARGATTGPSADPSEGGSHLEAHRGAEAVTTPRTGHLPIAPTGPWPRERLGDLVAERAEQQSRRQGRGNP